MEWDEDRAEHAIKIVEISKLMHQHSHNLPLAYYFYSSNSLQSTLGKLDLKPKKVFIDLNFQLSVVQRSIKAHGTKVWNSFSPEFEILSFRKSKNKYKDLIIATYQLDK